ncbi:MAG: DUF3187 family protein, partial [Verrucomicrobiota bacterium]
MNKVFLALLLGLVVNPAWSADMEITPFRAVNQGPLVQIYGFPRDTGADIVASGKTTVSLFEDITSNYTAHDNGNEQILLDGEAYRTVFAVRRGLGRGWEVGLELPLIVQGGGFLDSLIIDWHKTFGLPQGGRDDAPKNRVSYRYTKDGVEKLRMENSGSGIGDLSLNVGFSLYERDGSESRDRVALKAALKLPTGDASTLRGSGSTDLSLALCGSMNNFTEWGSLGVFGSLGGMAATRGEVLVDQQNRLAGFGSAGIGWGPAEWISFKVQLNVNSAMYRGSSLAQLSKTS